MRFEGSVLVLVDVLLGGGGGIVDELGCDWVDGSVLVEVLVSCGVGVGSMMGEGMFGIGSV